MKIILIFILLTAILNLEIGQTFEHISKKIQNKCNCESCKINGSTFHDIRMKLYSIGKLKFLNLKSDTFFTAESYELETGEYYGQIWTSRGRVLYSYRAGKFIYLDKNVFTNYETNLISKWDTATLRKEGSASSQISQRIITAARVILSNDASPINCIRFKDFYNVSRD